MPDGYEPLPDGGIRLVDPLICPGGHEFAWGKRQGVIPCREHRDHSWWICECGQQIYRVSGAFVGELDCQ